MKKLAIGIVVLFIFVLIFNQIFYYPAIKNYTNEIYKNKSQEVIKLFNSEVEKKFGKTFAMTYLLAQDEKLIKALLTKDRSLINYTKIINEVQEFGGYKNLWIQIIDKDGYSFYRSWTKKIGDHAASARLDIADMLKNPKPMRGISTGRFDMTFKTMIPLYDGDNFIGIIEMISKFNSIAKILKSKKIEPIMVVHEDYTKRFIKPFSGLFIDNNYVANLNASKTLMKKIGDHGLKEFMYIKEPMNFENYLVFTTQIKNVHGGEMGFFIFFVDENDLDKSLIYNFKTEYFIKTIIVMIIAILLLLYLISRNYANQLNKQVDKKTKKIKEQQKKINSLFEIYDENVIFSKTDLKGIITYVSKAFCEISGYKKEELIGQSHNIVRHPDMQKEAFKEMWETIKTGEKWQGEIKNLKKDGSYYWVDAKVEPIYEEGKIIGYTSRRDDITARKEYEDQQLRMLHQTKMAAMGEMIGNIAHQWRQPLSVITTIASGVSFKQEMSILDKKDIPKEMDHIINSANYLSETIETFRNFLKDSKEYKEICIQDRIKDVISILSTTIKNHNIKLIDNASETPKIVLNMVSGEIEQVIINIINNAKDVFIEKEIKKPWIKMDLEEHEDKIILSIEDNGGGIPDDIASKIFEAYFTTKHQSQGTGLGLNMSYKIVTESLGGKLYTKNTENGAMFIIEVPIK